MEKFIEYFGSAHLNSKNVAAYQLADCVTLKAEHIETGKVIGKRDFDSYDDAEEWFCNLPGSNNVSRLDSALDALNETSEA